MSGWSTSRTTIFAARRVLPPDLIVPAQASAPRMKLTGPEARPPLERCSTEPRMLERLIPEPEPPRKIIPSLVFQSRIDSIVSSTLRMKQAEHCGCLLEADVEPDRRVEGRLLVEQDRGQLHLEGVGVLLGGEVAALAPPVGDRPGDPADHLFDRALALLGCRACRGSTSGRRCWSRSGDQLFGNSTPRCSKAGLSGSPITASRISHSISSKGCIPASRKTPLDREALQTVFGTGWWRSWTSNFSSRGGF